MKKISLLIIAVLTICICSFSFIPKGQKEFEGIITYKTTLESKTEMFSTEQLQKTYGDKMVLYIKNGDYRMEHNGVVIKDIYYLHTKNLQYQLRQGIDTLYIISCMAKGRSLVSSEIKESAEKILNRNCKKLVNDLGPVKNHYWFDTSIYIDPVKFKKYTFGYVDLYYKKAQSPWLKHLFEGQNFNLTYTATDIKEIPLNDSVFKLPDLPHRSLK